MSIFQKAVESLTAQAQNAATPLEAMHYTQAALNLAYVMTMLQNIK